LTIGGVIQNDDVAGRSLTKAGAGTLTLRGVNTYSGATNVNAGTLIVGVGGVGSTHASSAVSVASGATLSGSGTVNGAVTVSGAIAPGNSIGTLTVNNDVTWNAGNAWKFELGAANASDRLAIAGAGNDFLKGTGSAGDWTFDFMNSAVAGTFDLVTWAGGTTGFSHTDFSYTNLGSGYSGNFQITGTTLQFVSVIPEPGTALAGLLLTAGLLRRRRSAWRN
jgi:autotransporter-associated beta strand protein